MSIRNDSRKHRPCERRIQRTCAVSPRRHTCSREQVRFFGCPVAGQDQRFGGDGAIGDQVVEIVALSGGVFAHREVIDDEDQGAGVFAHALAPGAIGVPAGEVGEHSGAFDEPDFAAASGHLVAECLPSPALRGVVR
jgi:hypothetical protein